jgi:hypothetical protein
MFIPQMTSSCILALLFATWSWDLTAVRADDSPAVEGQRLWMQRSINPKRKQQLELQQRKRKEKMDRYAGHLVAMNAQHSKDGKRFLNISLAAPDQYLSFASFDTAAVPMTAEERGGRGCSFLGAHCPTEATEQSLLQRFLSPSDTVLEVRTSRVSTQRTSYLVLFNTCTYLFNHHRSPVSRPLHPVPCRLALDMALLHARWRITWVTAAD